MLTFHANQYEFGDGGSEEELRLAASAIGEFENVDDFVSNLDRCSRKSVAGLVTVPLSTYLGSAPLTYIEEFLGRMPPKDARTYEIRAEWNDIELIFEFESSFLWYHWTTSA